jgi:hypothetical protein
MPSKRHFHFVVPVWGESYTKLFAEACLPMLFTPGNLGAIEADRGHQFVIVTTWKDHQTILNSPSQERLRKLIQVEFVLIDGLIDLASSHAAMSDCYTMAMNRESVVPGETHFVFLTPDSFWPDGTFRRLGELVEKNFYVVMACGLRLNSEPVALILKNQFEQHPDNPAISSGELAAMGLEHLHQLSRAHNVLSNSEFLNVWPSHMYWINERDRQLVAHCFHLHPLMVQAPKAKIRIGTTIDGDFLDNLHYPLDRYHVLQEELIGFELSPSERDWGQPLRSPSLAQITMFSLLHANSRHWHFFGKRIVLNGSPDRPIDPFLEQLVDRTVRRIQRKRLLAMLIQKLRMDFVVRRIRGIRNERVRKLMRRWLA